MYTDKYVNIKMENVAWVEFVDEDPDYFKNIQNEGLVRIKNFTNSKLDKNTANELIVTPEMQ